MVKNEIIERRFRELINKADEIDKKPIINRSGEKYINNEKFHEWATSVLSLLKRVFREDSPQYINFKNKYDEYGGNIFEFKLCRGIFLAAKEDYESGYLFTVRGLIKAEDTADILEQAAELLQSDYKDVSCLLAGVSLEIALKELCNRNNIAVGKLDLMNIELCKIGLYNKGMQKQITAWAHYRNKAAHGEWSEYSKTDVDFMIQGIFRFIADYL